MVASMSARASSCFEATDVERCRENQKWPLGGAAICLCRILADALFRWRVQSGVVTASVVAEIIGVEIHGVATILFIVRCLVVRRLVEQADA